MIAFGTVVYSAALEYLKDFLNSLNNQTFQNFELVVVNDNINPKILKMYFNKFKVHYKIINVMENMSPADLRVKLIQNVKLLGYNFLILGDCDDIFDIHRVNEVIKCYRKNDSFTFYYNDLVLFDNSIALKELPLLTENINKILECNYLGLSNTAINLSMISYEFIESLYGCNSFVFDWYLFSRILCNGGKGIYVKKGITKYRIYENNFAGVSAKKQLEKEFEVKKKHYELMKKYDKRYACLLECLLQINLETVIPCSTLSYWWNNIKLEEEKV